tara:strand:+ start:919 stop:1521 length:603 start_codon:yes stop_codon:yes gene_type:complete
MSGCDDCNEQNLVYGYNYLKYGSNFPYYMEPAPVTDENSQTNPNENPNKINMQYCKTAINQNVCRWRTCIGPYVKLNNQKKIWNTVRVPASEYTMNKSSLTVYDGRKSWNKPSDRNEYSITKRNVPTRGNSTKRSITRMRPGSTSAPGIGVDIKHNSYDRYLAKLKGRGPLRTEKENIIVPKNGNKNRYYGIAYSNRCFC